MGKLNTALATNARARAARSAGGRPIKPRQDGKNASIRSRPRMLTNSWCFGPSGPSITSSSQGRSSPCTRTQYVDSVSLSDIARILVAWLVMVVATP